jgi:hypothetical protein
MDVKLWAMLLPVMEHATIKKSRVCFLRELEDTIITEE